MPMTTTLGALSDVMAYTVVAVARDAPFKDLVGSWGSGRSARCPSWRARAG